MLDLEMSASKISATSLPDRSPLPSPSSSTSPRLTAVAAYQHYLRLPELSALWTSNDFPDWKNESVIKPALQALEITFRFLSLTLSDHRPYADHRQWKRRLASLSSRQIELIAALCEEDDATAPIADLTSSIGVLTRDRSSQEVWKLPGTSPVVSRTSEASLLPRLAAWDKSEDVATKILFEIEAQMQSFPFTLGLGEPNLAGKPNLEYDLIVRPSDLHSLKRSPSSGSDSSNHENQALFTVHQILESWIFAARQLLDRIEERIDGGAWAAAAGDCWILERIWKLLAEVADLLLLMDPDDFLRLKSELAIQSTVGSSSGSGAFCLRSTGLMEIRIMSRDLKRRVPWILGVQVDPNGGPRVQEAAMGLFHSRRRGEEKNAGRIHLLQAFQAVEAAVKKYFFAYRQLITAAMGSLEATGNRGLTVVEPSDALSQMFLETPYFPSIDAAKTFLGEVWQHEHRAASTRSRFNT